MLFLSFNMYLYQTRGWYLSVLRVVQNFALCYRGTKVSYLSWNFIKLDWFLQKKNIKFLSHSDKVANLNPKTTQHCTLISLWKWFPNVTEPLPRHWTHLELWFWGCQSSFSGKELNGFFHLARMKNNSNIQGL